MFFSPSADVLMGEDVTLVVALDVVPAVALDAALVSAPAKP